MKPVGSNNTLGGMIDMGFDIMVNCSGRGCDRSKRIDLVAVAEKYGRDDGAMHDDLIKLPWRCDQCGCHTYSVIHSPCQVPRNMRPGREAKGDSHKRKKEPGGHFWTPGDFETLRGR
jgi:hypothetical protein